MLRLMIGVLVTAWLSVAITPLFVQQYTGGQGVVEAEESDEAEQEALRKLREKARADLNDTTWNIELKPRIASVGMRKQDTLSFEGDQMTSKTFSMDGYASTSFSMDVKNGVPIWQTIQVAKGRATISWRGEVYGDAMGGIMTERSVEGKAVNYNLKGHMAEQFQSLKREVVPETVEAVPVVSEPTQLIEEIEDEIIEEVEEVTPQLSEEPPVSPEKSRGLFW